MLERCTCCIGKKTIVALGGLIKDCPNCNGVGHIKVAESKSDEEINNELPRRGRPKKVSDEREDIKA